MKGVALVAAGVAVAFVVGLAVIAGGATGGTVTNAAVLSVAQLATRTCSVSGPVPGLGASQAANAGQIVSAALSASAENTRAAQIAVMTAMTESGLENLDHGDRDSLGLFQQRPSQGWGTPAQVMDPTYATDAFVKRLLALPGWQTLPPWVAAQAVQRSKYADGSNYQPNWTPAGAVLSAVLADGNTPGACGQGGGDLAGPPSGHGLPAGYAIPGGTPAKHAAVVAFALAQLGKPYVWAAAGPASFDCSGLTMAAWASVGVPLDHYTGDQQTEGQPATAATPVPGDLVLTPGSDSPGPGIAGHVGIYLGDSLVISAIDPQYGIAVQSWSTFVSGGLIAVRDPAPGE
ncbi:NlpC/P60 family protein [Acidimicrobiaceae bacterium USS-CC1]|uniref:NlpC/P60 family protein n=1 Tax=Acidiferrimicrobium australe TaxID=2664430 RepID=A0ABW9QNC5_9ACTN|nr:NlpC/P60 family protein [Acidiferrimicrobium australe]